ncbi:MAG: immune inhibitor A [Candidatus Cloacimonetes bacterium]|nr:immune inhibitor A [Candidatus Cloacimonadota bacterium]
MKRKELIVTLLLLSLVLLWSAPPHPLSFWQEDGSFKGVSEIYGSSNLSRTCGIPDSILVLRCQFSDVSFDLDAEYPPGNPDTLPHDEAYFERLLFHLSTYWSDVSHGHYDLSTDNFTLLPAVYTLSQPMSYYGDDDLSTERVSEMIVELLDMADADVDYSAYDSYMIFHAGAGQEADLTGLNVADIWTTFVTRSTLQEGLDPENDDFPGLEYDGKILKEFIIAPETERQPDIQAADPIFGLLGVLCHEFGRQMGLPTLYDNQSSNGKSAGIGNYGVMGTGLWNAAGFVPPLPCAWSRIYMGWEIENLEVIDEDTENLEILGSLLADGETPSIYRVLISQDEYYLLENRVQNPDNSTFVNGDGDTLATFSFAIVPGQEYYPEGHPYAGQPYFNFMENTYAGCEWDFYLPGYGEGDALTQDGSGICIWHVDELVMREKFNLEEEINIPNGDELHKAVDLEEADGSQGLDTYGYYGNRDDTYRAGNNDYFGYLEHNGLPWTPTAESYYGGIQLEIRDISAADSVMSFSVDYEWSLDSGYIGINTLPAAFLDFGDGEDKLFYPMPDGSLVLWENNEIIAETALSADTLSQCWSWEPQNKKILLPAQTNDVALLYAIDGELAYQTPELFIGWEWAAPILINDDGYIVMGFNSTSENGCQLIVKDADLNTLSTISLPEYSITANMIYSEEVLIPVSGNEGNSFIGLIAKTGNYYNYSYETEAVFEPTQVFQYGISGNNCNNILMTTADSLIVILTYDNCVDRGMIQTSREIATPFVVNSYPSLADINGDGKPELLLGGENSFLAMNEEGELSRPARELTSPDSAGIMAGAVAINTENGLEVVSMMSQNRLCIWENVANNDFEMKRYYPVAYGSRSRNYPLFRDGMLLFPSDNGRIYRDAGRILPEQELAVEYANLQRTGCTFYEAGSNQYETVNIFVDDETYVYPNPYSTIFNTAICNGTMQTGKVAIRIMLSIPGTVKIKIYDIAGNRILSEEMMLSSYNAESYLVDAEKLASGVYFAKLETAGAQKLLKFGIEK